MKKVTNFSQNRLNDLVMGMFCVELEAFAGMSSDDVLTKSVSSIENTDLTIILLLFKMPKQYLSTEGKILFCLYLFQEKFITFLYAREITFDRALCLIERIVIILMLFLKFVPFNFVPFNTDIDGAILAALF